MEPFEEYKEAHKDPLLTAINERVELSKNYTQICCPKCDSELSSEEINIQEKIGKCGTCHVVFPFGDQLKQFKNPKPTSKQEIIRPEGIEMFYFKDELELSFKQPVVWIEAVFFALSLPLYIIGLGRSLVDKSIWPIILLFLIPASLGYIYSRIRKNKHRLYISANKDYLTIQHRPKKFIKDKEYACKDIIQLYTHNLGNWQVKMIIDEGEGQKHVVIATTESATKAKFIEQEIEAHLNIVDTPVKDVS